MTEADLEEEGKRKHVFDMERIEPGAYFVYEVMIEMIHQGKVFEVELSSYDEKETTANRAKLLMMLQASRQAKGGDGDYQVLHSWIDTVVHGEDGFLSLELDDDDEIETFLDQSQIARFLFADPEGRSEEEYEGPEAFMLVHRMVGCDEGSLCYDTVVVPLGSEATERVFDFDRNPGEDLLSAPLFSQVVGKSPRDVDGLYRVERVETANGLVFLPREMPPVDAFKEQVSSCCTGR